METNEKSRMSADEKNWQANMEIQAWRFSCQVARDSLFYSLRNPECLNHRVAGLCDEDWIATGHGSPASFISLKITRSALRRAILCFALAMAESEELTIYTGVTSFLVALSICTGVNYDL